MIYQPIPETTAARALDFILEQSSRNPKGAWVSNTDIAHHLGVRTNAVRPSLERAVAGGLVEKSTCPSGFLQWRLAVIKPRRKPKDKPTPAPAFSIPDWPPGFVAQFDSVEVPSYETRRK